MAKTDSDAERFNRIVVWSLAVTAVLLLASMFFVLSNETYYSAYVEGGDTDEEKLLTIDDEVHVMEDLDKGNGEVSLGYDVANTIFTPMLVNDWRDPHRSMLVIVDPKSQSTKPKHGRSTTLSQSLVER